MKKLKGQEIAYQNRKFLDSPPARSLRILSEYLEPLDRLKSLKVNNTVLFLGSSKAEPKDRSSLLGRTYWEAEELAYLLAEWAIGLKPKGKNFVICTGAGPGIMEAANRGASRAGGKSIGMNIDIPEEQPTNSFISPELSFLFHYFFMRKFWLLSKARAVVAFPGGFGTLDEVFEILTLIQTGKVRRSDIVIVLYNEDYWRHVIRFDALLEHGAIDPLDMELFSFCSSPVEAFGFLKKKLSSFLK